MSATRGLVSLCVAGALTAGPATAQYRPGLTVRVATREGTQPIVGLLRGSDSSSITVDSVAVPFSVISRVELYQGSGGHAGEAALIGATVGFLVGYAVGEQSGSQSGPGYGTLGGIIGAPILGLVGAAWGASFPAERWSEIPLERLRSAGARRSDAGPRIGFSIQF